MFFSAGPKIKINSGSSRFTILLLCLLFGFIVTTAEAQNVTIASGYFNKIIQFPQISFVNSTEISISCPSNGGSSGLTVYSSFFSQIGTFVPIVGFLITVTIYGTKSIFGYETTCILDDIVILTSTLAIIFSWYTYAKPLWFAAVAFSVENRAFSQDYSLIFSIVVIVLVVTFLYTVIWLTLARFSFHASRERLDEKLFGQDMTYRDILNYMKEFTVLAYLFHALEVVTYSVLQYIYIFTPLFRNYQQIYITSSEGEQGVKRFVVGETAVNLLFLNYFMNLWYLVMAFILVWTFYVPSSERYLPFVKYRHRGYLGFVRKKIFFFTVILCISHIFFEYYWFCTPAFFSTFFNTVLVTILARSIASYFSGDGIVRYTDKHALRDKDSKRVYAHIEVKDIKDVVYFYMSAKKDDKTLRRYRVNSTEGYFYVCEEDEKFTETNEEKRLLDLLLSPKRLWSLFVVTFLSLMQIFYWFIVSLVSFILAFNVWEKQTTFEELFNEELKEISKRKKEFFYFVIVDGTAYFYSIGKLLERDVKKKKDDGNWIMNKIEKFFTVFLGRKKSSKKVKDHDDENNNFSDDVVAEEESSPKLEMDNYNKDQRVNELLSTKFRSFPLLWKKIQKFFGKREFVENKLAMIRIQEIMSENNRMEKHCIKHNCELVQDFGNEIVRKYNDGEEKGNHKIDPRPENEKVFLYALETGFLNYLIYSHRKNEDKNNNKSKHSNNNNDGDMEDV